MRDKSLSDGARALALRRMGNSLVLVLHRVDGVATKKS